jgi:hypothetical protein
MTEQSKPRDVRELVRRKAAELVTMFTAYLKDKQVCEGRIGLEAHPEQDGYSAILKVATAKSNAEYRLGARVLKAYYDEEIDLYKLKRYGQPVGGRQEEFLAGTYPSAHALLQAVEVEVLKL